MVSVSEAVTGTRVLRANSARASALSMRIGSSYHSGLISSSASAMRMAAWRFQRECSSTAISMRRPTASRIWRKGSSARSICSGVMCWPSVASANWSKGQIFIAVMPISRSERATSAARPCSCQAIRSS